jgi:hypothetical protein
MQASLSNIIGRTFSLSVTPSGVKAIHRGLEHDIPFSQMTGMGIGMRTRRLTTSRELLLVWRAPNGAMKSFQVGIGADGQTNAMVDNLARARPDLWRGTVPYHRLRKELGLSNAGIFIAIGIAIVAALVIVGVVAATMDQSSPRAPNRSVPRARR